MLVNAYSQLKIGNPLDQKNHVGPLIDTDAVKAYVASIEKCKKEGGNFIANGAVLKGKGYESGCYVKPCIAEAKNHFEIVQQETFAPNIKPWMKLLRCKTAFHKVYLLPLLPAI